MADATYPLLRRRPRVRRRWSLSGGKRVRIVAVALLALALLAAIVTVWRRDPPPDARAALASALRQIDAGNYSAARTDAQTAIAGDATSGVAHAVLAHAYLELGDGVAGEGAVMRATALGLPPAKTRHLLAGARLLQGDLNGVFAQAAKPMPANGYPTRTLARMRARALAARGDVPGAQAALLAIAPRDAKAWIDLGRVRLTAGDIGGAADAATRAARLAPRDPAALVLQGEVVRHRFGLIAALPWFDAALARDAYYPPALAERAATLGDLGLNAQMLAATRALLAARPGDARALYLQAVLAARAGKADLSRRLLQATGSTLADLPGAMLLGGALAFEAEQWEQAAAQWRRLLVAQPLNVTARRLLAAALLRSGDMAGAASVLRPLVLRADADSYALSLALLTRPDALSLVDRAAMIPGQAIVFAVDSRTAQLRAEAAAAPTDPSYALGILRGLVGSGQVDAAVTAARALVAAAPGAPPGHLALGDALLAARRPRDAVTAYTRAADLRFDEPTMLRLVDAAARSGDRAQAARTLALYLDQNPQSVTARRLLGRWQNDAGDHAAAIETLEEVRRVIGDRDAVLLAELAIGYAGDDDGAVARVYGRAAYALAPMSARVADAYGVALAAAGEIDGARQLLAKAAALAPGDAAIAEHRRQLR